MYGRTLETSKLNRPQRTKVMPYGAGKGTLALTHLSQADLRSGKIPEKSLTVDEEHSGMYCPHLDSIAICTSGTDLKAGIVFYPISKVL